MRIRALRAAVAVALLAGALVPGSPPVSASSPTYDVVVEEHIVDTRPGQIHVQVVRPVKNGRDVRGPAILTYSPYSALGRSNDADRYARRGYIRVWADVLGTGNSGGCYDFGGKREVRAGHDVVEWIAKQPWSTGRVAMIGGSYNGMTATAVATSAPKHLTTIVPEAAPSSLYGYLYSGGIRHSFNSEHPTQHSVDTPLLLSGGLALPPPSDVSDPTWAERVASSIVPCDEPDQLRRGYSDTPTFDGFWRARDFARAANKIRVPVLIGHNWGDWNVKPDHPYNLFKALRKSGRSSKVSLFMGNRYEGHRPPGGNYEAVKDAWLDHYLMGRSNGIPRLPAVISQQADHDGPRGWYRGGVPKTRAVELIAQYGGRVTTDSYWWNLLPTKPTPEMFGGRVDPSSFSSIGVNAEAHANFHGRMNHEWLWFETPYLRRDTRIFGAIKVQLYSKVLRKWVTLTPTVVDVDHRCHEAVGNQHGTNPDCLPRALHSVTRGFLDSRYRKGLGKEIDVEPGKPFNATVVTKPQDYVFKKDHIIALNVQTEINDWMIPNHYPGCEGVGPTSSQDELRACTEYNLEWEKGKSRILIPFVGNRSAKQIFRDRFYVPHH